MKFTRLITGLFALLLLLPIQVSAQDIHVYPGPDEDWNYLYDYGDVEVGASGVMIFQIECALDSLVGLIVDEVYIEDVGPFTITDEPSYPQSLGRGESIYVEVTFTPPAEGLFEGVMRIATNATIPPGTDIHYALQGMGVPVQTPEQMMLDLIDFYDEAIAEGWLSGRARGQSSATTATVFREMLVDVYDLIVAGNDNKACRELSKVLVRIDGANSPPDLVEGSVRGAVYNMLVEVGVALECF